MSETDPLLPRNRPAPEISGYGYSQFPNEQLSEQEVKDGDDEDIDSRPSPLSTILALFTIVVSFALFIALLVPGGLGSSGDETKNKSMNVKERVNKILTKTPLIGDTIHLISVWSHECHCILF